ncbi:hypothetical protein ACHAXN_003910 [Cyclotella atomus]
MLELRPESINALTNVDYTCLHILLQFAIEKVDEAIIRFAELLLMHAPWLISAIALDGYLPLHTACRYGLSLSVIKFLYDECPYIIHTRNKSGSTPLDVAQGSCHYANDHTQDAVIIFFRGQLSLINEAENVTKPDFRGQLPIHRAVFNADLPVGTVKLLLEANPDSVLIADCRGQTPLHIACRRCSLDVIKCLVDADEGTLRNKDASGDLPLQTACRHGKCNVVKWLLEMPGSGVSVVNNEGRLCYFM